MTMTGPRLTSFKFLVYGGDPDNPEEYEVRAFGRDIQKAEELFGQRGWGSATSAPLRAANATAYFAMWRTGQFKGTFDEFEDWYLAVEPQETPTAVPTGAGAEPA